MLIDAVALCGDAPTCPSDVQLEYQVSEDAEFQIKLPLLRY